jgi:hypothetical protein
LRGHFCSIKFTLSKGDDSLTFVRFFTRKTGLSVGQETDLRLIVNKMNVDLSYQVYLTDEHIAFALYAHGPYQRRTLAVIVRLIEKANDHFDSYPGLLELLNETRQDSFSGPRLQPEQAVMGRVAPVNLNLTAQSSSALETSKNLRQKALGPR